MNKREKSFAALMKREPRISVNPKIMGGSPCIKDTRIPLYVILDNLEGGCSLEEIRGNYPSLAVQDIQAAIRFSSNLTSALAHANPAR